MILLIYGIFRNYISELIYKAEIDSQTQKQIMASKGDSKRWGDKLKIWD